MSANSTPSTMRVRNMLGYSPARRSWAIPTRRTWLTLRTAQTSASVPLPSALLGCRPAAARLTCRPHGRDGCLPPLSSLLPPHGRGPPTADPLLL